MKRLVLAPGMRVKPARGGSNAGGFEPPTSPDSRSGAIARRSVAQSSSRHLPLASERVQRLQKSVDEFAWSRLPWGGQTCATARLLGTARGADMKTGMPRTPGEAMRIHICMKFRSSVVRATLFTATALGCVVAACIGAPQAQAQFVCFGIEAGVVGFAGTATGGSSMACGPNARATDDFATATGTFAAATGLAATATGESSLANGTRANATGAGANAIGENATAIGTRSNATGINATALGGPGTIANGTNATALGQGSLANGDATTAIGQASTANGTGATAIGQGSTASASGAVAVGFNSAATGVNGIAIGNGATATGSIAVGGAARAANGGAAFGDGAVATGSNATAIGPGASATFANSSAFGAGATATAANQMAFGTALNTYRLPGITSAASLAAQSGPTSFVTTDAGGNLAATNFGPQNIAGLSASVTALQQGFSIVQENLQHGLNQAYEGTAVAIAMSGSALPDNKRFAITSNWGNFRGTNAMSFIAQARISDNIVANAGFASGFQYGGVGSRAGLTFAW